MLSCNVSPGLFQIERRGKCQCRSLSAKSIKSALSVASWAYQQDNCPFTAHVFRAFSQDLKMHFSIQHATPPPPPLREKAWGHRNKNFCFHKNIYLLKRYKLLIFGLCPSLQDKDRYNRSFLNYPLTVILSVCLSVGVKNTTGFQKCWDACYYTCSNNVMFYLCFI